MHNYLTGRRNVRDPKIIKRLTEATDTSPFLWMDGGNSCARRAALEVWAAGLSVSEISTPEQG